MNVNPHTPLTMERWAALDAAASPGPWEFGDYNIVRSGPTSPVHDGPTVKESLDFDAWERDPNAQGDGPPLWHSTVHVMQPAADPKYGSSAYTLAIVPGDKEVRDANCALIAASRNAPTRLLSALRALATYLDACGNGCTDDSMEAAHKRKNDIALLMQGRAVGFHAAADDVRRFIAETDLSQPQ